ncbi:uncharacterized protein LOC142566807 [Dermacentor variabilis]|uniref:uncharacterized protein LOC142566807 n=1 Tax=Dermacentor variabilis TaxID=34621 RepID=UPI003F5BAAC9
MDVIWEQSNGTVHANTTLCTTDKFHYLPNYLVGEAATAISGRPTTEACYESAIQLLNQLDGTLQAVRAQELDCAASFQSAALQELQPVTTLSDTRELRRLYDGVQLNVRGLNVLEVPTSTFAAMLYDVLVQSLPQEIVVAFHRHSRLQDDAQGTTSSA